MTDQETIDQAAVKLSTTSLHGRFLTMDQCGIAVQALAGAGLLNPWSSVEEEQVRAENAEAERDALAATVQRVRITHRQITLTGKCQACRKPWPCSTIRVLDDPQEQP